MYQLIKEKEILLVHSLACEQAHIGAQGQVRAKAQDKPQDKPQDKKVILLAPLHQTPSCWITLLFTTHGHDSKGEPARKLVPSQFILRYY